MPLHSSDGPTQGFSTSALCDAGMRAHDRESMADAHRQMLMADAHGGGGHGAGGGSGLDSLKASFSVWRLATFFCFIFLQS